MNLKNSFVQGAVLIVVAAVLALVSNAVAGRERKLLLPGWYPNALTVPAQPAAATVTPAAPVTTATTATVAPSTAPFAAPQPALAPPPTQSAAPLPPAADATSKPVTNAAERSGVTPSKPSTSVKPGPAIVAKAEVVDADPVKRFPPHPDKPYVEISGNDAAWLRSKGALVLDARRGSVYEQGHIAGARSFPVWESDIDERVNKLFAERSDPRQQLEPVVIYCSGGECEDSHMLAQKLWGVQFNNVYVYRDGFPDWQKRGGPIHNGSNP